MKKSEVALWNILTLFLLNITFFLCNTFPKHIIEINTLLSIISIIVNLLFYIIYFLSLIIFFKKDKTWLSDGLFERSVTFVEKFEVKKLCVLLLVQVLFDIIKMLISMFVHEWIYFIYDTLTFANWITIYIIVSNKKTGILGNKKISAVTSIFLIIIFFLNIYINMGHINQYWELANKYQITSEYFIQSLKNIDFVQSLKNLTFDTLIGSLLIIFHNICLKKLHSRSKKKRRFQKRRLFVMVCSRITILLMIAFMIIGGKYLIFPSSCLKSVGNSKVDYSVSQKSFYAESNVISLARMEGYSNEKNVFLRTQTNIYYGNNKLCSLKTNNFEDSFDLKIDGNMAKVDDGFEKFELENNKVLVYKNQAICFIEQGIPYVVRFDELAKTTSFNTITEICKYLISKGNINAFEYSCEYLLKNDPEYIKPYIDRYSKAFFSTEELNSINELGYRKEYIVNIAKQFNS